MCILPTWHQHTTDTYHIAGPVIRQGPNKLVFNSATALKCKLSGHFCIRSIAHYIQDIYHDDRITKPVTYLANHSSAGVDNVWSSLDRGMHRQRRKLIGPALNDRSVKVFEPTINEQVDIFIRQLALGQDRQPIDMKERVNHLILDIISLLSFGFPLQTQTNEEYRFLTDSMVESNHRMNVYMQIPVIPRYRLQNHINRIWSRSREKFLRFLDLMIQSRMSEDVHAKYDVYSFLADTLKTDEGKNFRAHDLWMEALLFIIAGLEPCSFRRKSQ